MDKVLPLTSSVVSPRQACISLLLNIESVAGYVCDMYGNMLEGITGVVYLHLACLEAPVPDPYSHEIS